VLYLAWFQPLMVEFQFNMLIIHLFSMLLSTWTITLQLALFSADFCCHIVASVLCETFHCWYFDFLTKMWRCYITLLCPATFTNLHLPYSLDECRWLHEWIFDTLYDHLQIWLVLVALVRTFMWDHPASFLWPSWRLWPGIWPSIKCFPKLEWR